MTMEQADLIRAARGIHEAFPERFLGVVVPGSVKIDLASVDQGQWAVHFRTHLHRLGDQLWQGAMESMKGVLQHPVIGDAIVGERITSDAWRDWMALVAVGLASEYAQMFGWDLPRGLQYVVNNYLGSVESGDEDPARELNLWGALYHAHEHKEDPVVRACRFTWRVEGRDELFFGYQYQTGPQVLEEEGVATVPVGADDVLQQAMQLGVRMAEGGVVEVGLA